MKIIYTKHAKRKFKELERLGIKVSRRDITETTRNPEHSDRTSDFPKLIASNSFDKTRIIRVVFRKENDKIIVITFYSNFANTPPVRARMKRSSERTYQKG